MERAVSEPLRPWLAQESADVTPPADASPEERTARVLAEQLPRIRSLLHRIAGSTHELDDMTQDALIELARALPGFQGRAQLSTFVHTITVRVAYRWLAATRTRRTREVALELLPPPVHRLDPESRAMARQALRELYRTLDHLSDPLRIAFVLCELEGMDPMEAARVERVTPGTMRTRLSRAKEAVRRSLEHDPYLMEMRRNRGPRA